MNTTNTEALLWLDVETTGLSPEASPLLEIGAICTSMDGRTEYGRYTAITHIDTSQLLTIELGALHMHTANGLLAECEQGGISEQEIADQLADFIDRLTSEHNLTLHPAGSNIQRFDLPAINRMLERHDYHGFLKNQLHYRGFDMSTIRMLKHTLGIDTQPHQHGTHRVTDCLTRDITEWQTLTSQLEPLTPQLNTHTTQEPEETE